MLASWKWCDGRDIDALWFMMFYVEALQDKRCCKIILLQGIGISQDIARYSSIVRPSEKLGCFFHALVKGRTNRLDSSWHLVFPCFSTPYLAGYAHGWSCLNTCFVLQNKFQILSSTGCPWKCPTSLLANHLWVVGELLVNFSNHDGLSHQVNIEVSSCWRIVHKIHCPRIHYD